MPHFNEPVHGVASSYILTNLNPAHTLPYSYLLHYSHPRSSAQPNPARLTERRG